jgi:hypothetical protein
LPKKFGNASMMNSVQMRLSSFSLCASCATTDDET